MTGDEYMKIIKNLVEQLEDAHKCYFELSEKYIQLIKKSK